MAILLSAGALALLAAMGCEALLGFDELEPSAGGAGGATTGTASGTASGTSTGPATGTPSGTAAGPATGTPSGTAAGTAAGTTTTFTGSCPSEPCTAGAALDTPCASALACIAAVCTSRPACCEDAWDEECVALALRACPPPTCNASATCWTLFHDVAEAEQCTDDWNDGCVMLLPSSLSSTCKAYCEERGGVCTWAQQVDTCDSVSYPQPSSLVCDELPDATMLKCGCGVKCGSWLCPPGQTCFEGACY